MTRRATWRGISALFLPVILAAKDKPSEKLPPTDAESMDRFAQHYNDYAAEYRKGKIDIKLWNKAVQSWKELV